MKRKWAVYYQSREYARVHGDPCLGYLWAADKAEALDMALRANMGYPDGPWVVPYKEKTGETLAGCSPVGAVGTFTGQGEGGSHEQE